jgi:hypothetical protein
MSLSTLSIICLGFDVHKGSITFAVLPSGTKRPRLERLPHRLPKPKRHFDQLARKRELRTCYEARCMVSAAPRRAPSARTGGANATSIGTATRIW